MPPPITEQTDSLNWVIWTTKQICQSDIKKKKKKKDCFPEQFIKKQLILSYLKSFEAQKELPNLFYQGGKVLTQNSDKKYIYNLSST